MDRDIDDDDDDDQDKQQLVEQFWDLLVERKEVVNKRQKLEQQDALMVKEINDCKNHSQTDSQIDSDMESEMSSEMDSDSGQ